jgi:hypothetical protein
MTELSEVWKAHAEALGRWPNQPLERTAITVDTEGLANLAAGQFNRYAGQSSHLLIRFVTRPGK